MSVILFYLISIRTVMGDSSFMNSKISDVRRSLLFWTVSVHDANMVAASVALGPETLWYTYRGLFSSVSL